MLAQVGMTTVDVFLPVKLSFLERRRHVCISMIHFLKLLLYFKTQQLAVSLI